MAKVEHTHRKQTGGRGQFARVVISIEPIAEGYEFVNRATHSMRYASHAEVPAALTEAIIAGA